MGTWDGVGPSQGRGREASRGGTGRCGGVPSVRSLPAYDADGFWAYAVGCCTPGADRFLVLVESLVD